MSERAILLVSSCPKTAVRIQAAAAALCRRLVRVSEADKALRCLSALPTVLVIADQDLPDGSGIEFLQETARLAPFSKRLLILKADADADIAVEALNRTGVCHLLRKPLDNPSALRETLAQALSKYDLDEQGRAAIGAPQAVLQGNAGKPDARTRQLDRLYTTGEMASGLIHKFNNTLSIIIGHLELLLEDGRGKELEDRLRPILQSATDSVQLTRSLQEFLRSGPSERVSVDVNRLILETLRMTEPLWKSGSRQRNGPIQIDTELRDLPSLSATPSEIREVLTNLILNAVDAMPAGGQLTVRTGRTDDWLRIEIEDTGVGMNESVRRRIFEPFFTTKGKHGNGLGLSIVRRIVREHGGDIRIESQPGKGSRFVLMFPGSGTQPEIGARPVQPFTRLNLRPARNPFRIPRPHDN